MTEGAEGPLSERLEVFERKGEGVVLRLGAQILDYLLITSIWLVVGTIAGVASLAFSGAVDVLRGEEAAGLAAFAFFLTYPAVWFAYFFLLEGTWGTTPGKLVGSWPISLRVIRKGGGACGYGRAAVRALLGLLEVNIIGAVAIWTTRSHQRLGDLLAGTLVVDRSKVQWARFGDRRVVLGFVDGHEVELVGIDRGLITKWLGKPQWMKLRGVTPDGRRVALRARATKGATVFGSEAKMQELFGELQRVFQVQFVERLEWWRVVVIVGALTLVAVGLGLVFSALPGLLTAIGEG